MAEPSEKKNRAYESGKGTAGPRVAIAYLESDVI